MATLVPILVPILGLLLGPALGLVLGPSPGSPPASPAAPRLSAIAAANAAPRRRARAHRRSRPRARPIRGKVGPGSKNRWPPPIVTRRVLRVRLRWNRGRLIQRRLRRHLRPKARGHKRMAGRFLAQLYAGRKLRDVVPFNFPLLAPVENFTPTGERIARRLEARLHTATRLELPFPPDIDRIEIQDLATGKRWRLDLRKVRPRPRPRPRPRQRPCPRPRPRVRPR